MLGLNPTSRVAIGCIAVAGAALLLSGCAQQQPTADSASKPSTSATASTATERAPYDNTCDGAQAVISGDGDAHELGDCATVSIVSAGATVTLGKTKALMVEGSGNQITVTGTEHVTLLGSGNTVTVTGSTPEVDDQGHGNTVR